MQNLADLRKTIELELDNISYPESPEKLYQPIDYVINLGGKRIRPILLLMAHQLFDTNIKDAISPALGIEIFHNFTLLHDDIMDNAPLRRGQSTVHNRWDVNTAILSGDTMLVQAYQFLTDVDQCIVKDLLRVFNKAAKEVCEGQQWDMDFETSDEVTLSDYMRMIEYKTAVLLAAALQIGGITGGASDEEQQNLYDFGKNIGIAFQLKDDLLDTFGNPDTFGKQLGGDIIANKKTFLYLKAIELSDSSTNKKLRDYFSESDSSEDKVEKVKLIFNHLDIPKYTMEMIEFYYLEAIKHLNLIKSDNKLPLINFSETLMDRIS